MRQLLLLTGLAVILTSLGCCSPCGVGPGCAALDGGCFDCEGGFGPRHMATGPLDALRQARRSLVCGGGCGEVYYGEWISTPPYAHDPCDGAGCVERCTPYCVSPGIFRPGALIAGLYGKRFSDCGGCEACSDAGCGGCDSCGGESVIDSGIPADSGCASCSAQARTMPLQMPQRPQTRMASPPGNGQGVAQRAATVRGSTGVRTSTASGVSQRYR